MRVIIDTTAIADNAKALLRHMGGAKLTAAVKANGYGHGIECAARAALDGGADSLAVAVADEGVFLRERGISAPILVLGTLSETAAMEAVRHDLAVSVYDREVLSWLRRASEKLQKQISAHIQVETGMRRLGILPDHIPDLLDELRGQSAIQVRGVFSHFAETSDAPFVSAQLSRFLPAAEAVCAAFGPVERHIASSGTALSHPETLLDRARCGIALYGYPPCPTDVPLRPAMNVKTTVTQIQSVPPEESVSYGRTYYTDRETRIATISAGYGDGYARCIGNRGWALVAGRRAPVVGRVCMDLCMLDITEIPDVQVGDEVVLLGEQKGERISAEDWADWCGTISYEALLRPTERAVRTVL